MWYLRRRASHALACSYSEDYASLLDNSFLIAGHSRMRAEIVPVWIGLH